MSLRMKRRLFTFTFHGLASLLCLLGVVMGLSANSDSLTGFSLLILVVYVLTLRLNPLPRLILSRLIQQVTCEECGEVMDLSNTWSCHCGYVSWVHRSAWAPCRNCSGVFKYIVCPRCDASIYV